MVQVMCHVWRVMSDTRHMTWYEWSGQTSSHTRAWCISVYIVEMSKSSWGHVKPLSHHLKCCDALMTIQWTHTHDIPDISNGPGCVRYLGNLGVHPYFTSNAVFCSNSMCFNFYNVVFSPVYLIYKHAMRYMTCVLIFIGDHDDQLYAFDYK